MPEPAAGLAAHLREPNSPLARFFRNQARLRSRSKLVAPSSVLRGLITSTNPTAPHCDHQNDHQQNADHDKRGTHGQRLRRLAATAYACVYVTTIAII